MRLVNTKKKFFLYTGLLAGCCAVMAGGPPGTAVQPTDHFLNPSAVAVHGMLGQAIRLGEQGRLRTLPSWNNGTLITMFSTEARNKNNTTDWYGEHAGKWLYSAALAAKRTGNDSLKALLFKTAGYLVDHQEADGYMGSYSPELRITNKSSKLHKKSWDAWSLGCMVLGLLQVHEQFGDARCLASAQKIGELLLNTFGEGREDITNYGTRYGYSATVVLDPVVELYKATGDKRYLDFALLIVRQVEQKEGLRFIAAALNNRDMETVADGKAYQIIWNITGVAKLYEVTGTADYLRAVQNAWQNIHDYHLTVTGGPWGGIGKHKECFNTKGFWDPYGFIETCSIMSWIQLNKVLLHLTGEAKYAQEIEKAAYNALAGAQFANGEDWTYHSFTNGRRHPANFNDCCPSSGVLAMEELSPVIYSRRDKGIACNLYADNDATIELADGGKVHIVQKTGYPFDGKIRLEITPAVKTSFPLYIRIPEWVAGAQVSVNGQPVNAQDIKSGDYYMLSREWERGTVVEINFPLPLRLVQQAEYAIMPQGTADLYRVGWFALARGPLVYASDGLINGRDREMNFSLSSKDPQQLFKPAGTGSGNGAPAYRFTAAGVKPLLFRPFYEAGGRTAGTWRLTWMQSSID